MGVVSGRFAPPAANENAPKWGRVGHCLFVDPSVRRDLTEPQERHKLEIMRCMLRGLPSLLSTSVRSVRERVRPLQGLSAPRWGPLVANRSRSRDRRVLGLPPRSRTGHPEVRCGGIRRPKGSIESGAGLLDEDRDRSSPGRSVRTQRPVASRGTSLLCSTLYEGVAIPARRRRCPQVDRGGPTPGANGRCAPVPWRSPVWHDPSRRRYRYPCSSCVLSLRR